MRTILFSCLLVSQLSGQSVAGLARLNRAGDKLVAIENPRRISIFSTASGELELRSEVPGLPAIRDFDIDAAGALYLLTSDGEILKWIPQSAGFEFRAKAMEGAAAIAVDSAGRRIFAAAPGEVWMLDGEGEVARRASNRLGDVEKLRLDETADILYAQGRDFIASLSPSLENLTIHSSKGAVLPAASGANRAAAYPTGFLFEPASQTVLPGGAARFYLRTIQRSQPHGALALAIESPLPYQLERSALSLNDGSMLVIPVPAAQPPGVYRVVARLDGGVNGVASGVFIVPFASSTVLPVRGTAHDRALEGLADPFYRLVSSPDAQCATARVASRAESPVGSPYWSDEGDRSAWISGRADAINGCAPGLYRYRHEFDLRNHNPLTANIAVAAWADNAVTLEINGAAIAGEPQEAAEAEAFRVPRVYGLPREALRQGINSLDFIVRNDAFGTAPRNPTGLRVEVLHAAAVPIQNPAPSPAGDFRLTLTPPFQIVNGTTAYYAINLIRTGGFAATPSYVVNIRPPAGFTATINGNVLAVTRDPNVINAQTTWRFAVLGIFDQTTRSVDGAFIQNPYAPVDLPLVGTGVVQPGVPAADNSADARYALSASPDAGYPGPLAFVADFARSPFGPWAVNDQNSKWISPRPDPNGLSAPGVYRYRTTFDIGLGDPRSAAIALRWAADNDATIFLNGVAVTALFDIENFRGLTDALITDGFKAGVNTLEFAVNNANLGGPSQTGLRVEMILAKAARNPNRVVQVLRNQTSAGPALLSPNPFTASAPAGVTVTANATNLLISASDAAALGVFPVSVSYNGGGVTSLLVVVGAREAVSYVAHSTGQADEGSVDPNYRLLQSVDRQFPSQDAFVILSNTSPVSLGFWTPNTINSRWIAPRADTLKNNAPGEYRYRTTLDLTGRLASGAMLALEWACDNRGRIELNGARVDEIDTEQGFRAMRPVSITGGLRAGLNTLDFVVINDGAPYTISPTGLHVNMLGAFAVSQGTAPGPDFAITPDPGVRVINAGQSTTFDVRLNPNAIFVDPVVFSVVNPPAAFAFSFSPPASKDATVLTVTAGGQVARGSYPVTIRGRYGDIIREIQVRVDIAAAAPALRLASTGEAAAGSPDPNYALIDALGAPRAAYVADLVDAPPSWAAGRWITPGRAIERTAAGTFRYRTVFDLTGFNPATASIRGFWDADDGATAVLNGTTVATLNKLGFYEPGELLIDSGFRAGLNTLEFVVTNATPSATGLMVTIRSATAQPQ